MAFLEAAKREVWSVDRAMPVYLVRTMEETVSGLDWRTGFVMSLLAIFSAISLLLAVMGIYAALSYVVSQQTREFGIRMALGAERQDVLKLVVRQGMTLATVGVVTGVIASIALTNLMSSLLFGVSATDPLTFAGVALILGCVALIACYVPARRATKVDPLIALRYE
jgi:ABC-type antimicrobial peptide transport system permease subunit